MNIIKFRDKIIEEGIASIRSHEKGPTLVGGVTGFELCRKLNTAEDFEFILDKRHQEEFDMIGDDVHPEKYWAYRSATIQIEFVFDRMKILFGEYEKFSAQAILHVRRLMNQFGAKWEDCVKQNSD